jgi:hypothetical protein
MCSRVSSTRCRQADAVRCVVITHPAITCAMDRTRKGTAAVCAIRNDRCRRQRWAEVQQGVDRKGQRQGQPGQDTVTHLQKSGAFTTHHIVLLQQYCRALSLMNTNRADDTQYTTPRRTGPPMHTSGTLRSQTGTAGGHNTDTYSSRRYHYRSRSDLQPPPRRYASQTILDGARPGPTAGGGGTWRRDALENLQRELDTLSRSPVSPPDRRPVGSARPPIPGGTEFARGYSSDTGYMNDTVRSARSTTQYEGV